MSLTITPDGPVVERVSRNLGMFTGSIAFDSSYPTGGELLTDVSKFFTSENMFIVHFDPQDGYLFSYDKTNNKVIAYLASGTPAIVMAGTTAAGTGSVGAEAAHTHVITLDTGVSAAGVSHDHVISGSTAAPSATINAGYLLYQVREDPTDFDYNSGAAKAWTELDLSSVVPANTKAVKIRVTLSDNTVGSYIRVQQNGEGRQSYDTFDMMTLTAGRSLTQTMTVEVDADRKIEYSVFDAEGGGDAVTVFTITVLGWYEAVTLPTGVHIHAVGTLDAAAESTHTHGPGTLGDGTSGVGSSHTHTTGSHTHAATGLTATATAEAADEVGSGTNLSALTGVRFTAFGLI